MSVWASFPAMGTFDHLGVVLRLVRRLRELNQKELGLLARVAPGQISKYENGRTVPRLPVLDRILSALRITVAELGEFLEAVNVPAGHLRDADIADEVAEGGGEPLLLAEGDVLLPREMVVSMATILRELQQMQEGARRVLLGRALRTLDELPDDD